MIYIYSVKDIKQQIIRKAACNTYGRYNNLIIIYCGYTGGIKEGITAGGICGAVTVLGGFAGLSAIALYVFAGAVSGLAEDKTRLIIPAVLPASIYLFSMAAGYDFPYVAGEALRAKAKVGTPALCFRKQQTDSVT